MNRPLITFAGAPASGALRRLWVCLTLFAAAFCCAGQTPPDGDLLHFLDGSSLHGQLAQIQTGQVVRWKHPAARNELEFQAVNLDYIRFAQTSPLPSKSGCLFRFVNGDELLAALTSIDTDQIGLNAWFSSVTNVPRSAVQSITFLPANYTIAYEGPLGLEGWTVNPLGGWEYKDGAFTSRGNSAISRDFALTGSCTVEFDLAWTTAFGVWINLYADKNPTNSPLGFIPMSQANSYGFIMTAEGGELRRGRLIHTGETLGKAACPPAVQKNRLHVTIQSNQAQKTIALFADRQLVKRWKDTNENFAISGPGLLFADISGRPGLQLSNLRVSRWEGLDPEQALLTKTKTDSLILANRDKAGGTILRTTNGAVEILLGARRLNIPFQRISQINFAATNTPPPEPGSARAYLTGCGRISFQLEKWNNQEFSGRSPLFGPLALRSQSVRQLEFNPGRTREPSDEFGGLDE